MNGSNHKSHACFEYLDFRNYFFKSFVNLHLRANLSIMAYVFEKHMATLRVENSNSVATVIKGRFRCMIYTI